MKTTEYLETYRRGRNETDSKSVCPKGHEGSNPSVSALATMDLPFGRSFRFVKDDRNLADIAAKDKVRKERNYGSTDWNNNCIYRG